MLQYGIRIKCICGGDLITLSHEVTSTTDKERRIDLIFCEFSKEFKRVIHQRHLKKNIQCVIERAAQKWTVDSIRTKATSNDRFGNI